MSSISIWHWVMVPVVVLLLFISGKLISLLGRGVSAGFRLLTKDRSYGPAD